MKVKDFLTKDESLSDELTAFRFRLRWRLGPILFLIPFLIFITSAFYVKKYPVLMQFDWIFIVTAFIYGFFIYRCPRCGDHPKSSRVGTTGILFFPKKCAKCKAPLLPDHPWAQD